MLMDNINRLIKLKSNMHVIKSLVIKQFKARYAGSIIGILWTLLNPVLLAFVIAFVFSNIIKIDIPNFYLFIISGLLPWTFFSNSLQDGAGSIVNNSQLLKQFSIPPECMPAASLAVNFINFALSLAIVLPIFLITNYRIIIYIPALIAVCVIYAIFVFGLSLLLAALNAIYRDVLHVLNIALVFLLWLTPVFYTVDSIPERYRFLFLINPVTYYLDMTRDILLDTRMFSLFKLLPTFVISLVSLFFGMWVFLKQENRILKRI